MSNGPLTIFLVEDDEVDVMNVKRAFAQNNIRNPLFVARDGVEVLEKLRNGEIPKERRIVLLDLNMPRMNGIELLREVRNDPALCSTTVVVLTTSKDEQDKIDLQSGRRRIPREAGHFRKILRGNGGAE